MLNEKQIILKRKELLKQKRKLLKELKVKPRKAYQLLSRGLKNIALIGIENRLSIYDEILKGNKVNYKELKSAKGYNSILDEMKRIKPMIMHLLKTEPATRDDDNLLCVRVWEMQGIVPNSKMQTFKKRLITGKYAMGDSITRTRRILQAKYKSLQGKLYNQRHQAEQRVTNQIKLDF